MKTQTKLFGTVFVALMLLVPLAILVKAPHSEAQAPTPEPPPGMPTSSGTAPTMVPTATPLPSEPEAVEILRRSDAAMNSLSSAHRLTLVAGAIKTTEKFQAPDRSRLDYYVAGAIALSTVRIGDERWERIIGTDWISGTGWVYTPDSPPFRWPLFRRADPDSEWVSSPAHVRIDGEELVSSRATWRLKYESTVFTIEGWVNEYWTEWIDQETGRLLKTDMYDDDPWGAPGVIIETRYSAFNVPVDISPPLALPDAVRRLFLPRLARASPPVYVNETALAVAEARLDEWIANGEAPSDTVIESAIEITSADAGCFSMNGDLIAAGNSTDVAAVYSGDSITTAIPGRESEEYVLVIIEKTFGREYAAFSAPTLSPLTAMITCAGQQ